MMPCGNLKKLEGQSFGAGILVGGWRQTVRKRKVMKERDVIKQCTHSKWVNEQMLKTELRKLHAVKK